MVKNILIIHYNTPELTKALLHSINKHHQNTHIYIFDNSDTKPFTITEDIKDYNITLFDNTHKQYIDFDTYFLKYPDRCKKPISSYHSISVQTCMDIINDDFILMDSDILIKKPLNEIYDNSQLFVSDIIKTKNMYRSCPFICYINNPLCKKYNITYFNPDLMFDLHQSENDKGDTGCNLLDKSIKYNLPYKQICNNDFILHYGAGSYTNKRVYGENRISHIEWLEQNKTFW